MNSLLACTPFPRSICWIVFEYTNDQAETYKLVLRELAENTQDVRATCDRNDVCDLSFDWAYNKFCKWWYLDEEISFRQKHRYHPSGGLVRGNAGLFGFYIENGWQLDEEERAQKRRRLM